MLLDIVFVFCYTGNAVSHALLVYKLLQESIIFRDCVNYRAHNAFGYDTTNSNAARKSLRAIVANGVELCVRLATDEEQTDQSERT